MTQDPQHPFSFTAAVAEAYGQHPQLREKTLFISTAENPLDDKDPNLHVHRPWLQRMQFRLNDGDDAYLTTALLSSKKKAESFAIRGKNDGLRTVIFNPDDNFAKRALPQEQEMSRAASFYHELGHVLSRKGFDTQNGDPTGESIADAYAAIRLLQQYGDTAKPMLLRDSWGRAARFTVMKDDYSHYMTTGVVRRVIDGDTQARFGDLTPAETLEAAEYYAETYKPEQASLDQAAKDFSPLMWSFKLNARRCIEHLEDIAQTTLSTAHRFTFQVGAIVIQPFLHPEGVDIGDKTIRLQEEKRLSLLRQLKEGALRFGLPRIYRDLAENKADMLVPASAASGAGHAPVAGRRPFLPRP